MRQRGQELTTLNDYFSATDYYFSRNLAKTAQPQFFNGVERLRIWEGFVILVVIIHTEDREDGIYRFYLILIRLSPSLPSWCR